MTTQHLARPLLPSNESFANGNHAHSCRFITAFGSFIIFDWFYAYQQFHDFEEYGATKYDRHDWPDLVWATGQTLSLLLMTSARIDANRYLAQNPTHLILLLLNWIAFYITYSVNSWKQNFLFQALPLCLAALTLVYTLVRFKPVVSMQHGMPPLTQLFTLTLAFETLSHVGYYIYEYPRGSDYGYTLPLIVFWLAAPMFVVLAYRYSHQHHENPSLCFNASVVVYLLLIGAGYLLDVILNESINDDDDWVGPNNWGQRMVGPIHIIPTLGMLVFRTKFRRRLGRWWLRDQDEIELAFNESFRSRGRWCITI
jgi:hypothetical protein